METKEDLKVKIAKLKIDWLKQNNPVKLGDVIVYHNMSIEVKDFIFMETGEDGLEEGEQPQYLYTGLKLTVKGHPFKNMQEVVLMQSQIHLINRNPYDFETIEIDLDDFETSELIAEIKERDSLNVAVEDLEVEELVEGREDGFIKWFTDGFGDLNTPSEKETFKRFLCDLLGVSYHTSLSLNLTRLKIRLND